MKKSILFPCILILISQCIYAQSKVLLGGTITYECKLNMHKMMEGLGRGENSWMEAQKKMMPKYKLTHYDLIFNDHESIWKKSKVQPEQDMKKFGMMRVDDDNNVTYKNLETDSIVAGKQVFEDFMIIQDELYKAKWKMTNEFRIIQGYNCRRATTVIWDSLYIIAFYTDAITTQSGPEGMSGLPGMILGAVIPRLHLTYFATKINENIDPSIPIQPPSKGKKVTYKKLDEELTEATRRWGRFGGGRNLIFGYLY